MSNPKHPTTARYRIARLLGQGGMAEVYEAIAVGDSGFERRVALKKVLPEIAHEASARRMFLDEAHLASQFHHGNIVQVIDYGTMDGAEFLVMEYVDGIHAGEASRRAGQRGEAVPVGIAIHVVAEIAHALAYLHEFRGTSGDRQSAVHRDVSPSNVLLSWGGDVKLADFGVATIPSSHVEPEREDVAKGKREYRAPEQARGEVVTGAADVWSAGAMLRALVWNGDDTEATKRVPEVRDLIADCTKPSAAERCSAAELARRAGALAARQLQQSGRSALVEWLGTMRHEGPAHPGGHDPLLGWMIVPTQNARRFTVEEERPQDAMTEPPRARSPIAVAPPIPSVAPPLEVSTARRAAPPSLPWMLTAGGALAGALGIVLLALGPPPVEPPTAVHVVKTSNPAGPWERGWIRIGGYELFGAEISIDGEEAGHAPLELELHTGSHLLSVASRSGSFERTVQIAPKHTRRSALTIRP